MFPLQSIDVTPPIGNRICFHTVAIAVLMASSQAAISHDLLEFAAFNDCLAGPERAVDPDCGYFDSDNDGDIDLGDFSAFQPAFDGYSRTFPPVDPLMLGDCPAQVHDRFAVFGPDGRRYRTWHPITVPVDPGDPLGQACSFAHEHGDPPHANGPAPLFGYPAFHAGLLNMIKAHQGYKVFVHKRGQQTGWDTMELRTVSPDWDMQFWVHQGTSGRGRLTAQFHSAAFWSMDDAQHVTEVYVLADTGKLRSMCDGPPDDPEVRRRQVPCHETHAYEVWTFAGDIAGRWQSPAIVAVLDAMNHMHGEPPCDDPECSNITLVPTSMEFCVLEPECSEDLPLGHPDSSWLGRLRVLHAADWRWQNEGGPVQFCTDAYGSLAADALCDEQRIGYLLQRVAPVDFFGPDDLGVNSELWNRLAGPVPPEGTILPFGAPAGN